MRPPADRRAPLSGFAVLRSVSKLVSLGLLERAKVINDNKRYEISFNVPDALVEKLRRKRG